MCVEDGSLLRESQGGGVLGLDAALSVEGCGAWRVEGILFLAPPKGSRTAQMGLLQGHGRQGVCQVAGFAVAEAGGGS